MSNFEDSNRHMERKRQIEWLKIQKKGFFRHFLGCGLGFSIKNYCGKITHNKRLKRDCQRVAFPVQ
ncbi:hypothetical protein VCSRO99_3622 [Vibrio cholerae]|nr:hypothetical protein VCSRO99_3622 [Vibrio cholerae]